MSTSPSPSATRDPGHQQQLALLRGVPKPERLMRTLALSAFVRDVTYAGIARRFESLGEDALRQRFLTQLFGARISDELRRLIARL